MATLTHQRAGRLYDRIGVLLDSQRFYEDPATRRLVEMGSFGNARSVFELGCGTGRLAQRLLGEELTPAATYRGVDVSVEMVNLSRRRLRRFGPRAEIDLCDGGLLGAEPDGGCDRFLCTYVFDLLAEADIAAMVTEAHRMLCAGGLCCAASLTRPATGAGRWVSGAIAAVHRVSPALSGGCRPIALDRYFEGPDWQVRFSETVVSFGVATQLMVAERSPTRCSAPARGSAR
jgi:ubiquinone/menaquinone biosynthesis C-methylase UbiE